MTSVTCQFSLPKETNTPILYYTIFDEHTNWHKLKKKNKNVYRHQNLEYIRQMLLLRLYITVF